MKKIRHLGRWSVVAAGTAGLVVVAVAVANGLPVTPPVGLPRQIPRSGQPNFGAQPGAALERDIEGITVSSNISESVMDSVNVTINARLDQLGPLPTVVLDGLTITNELMGHNAFGLWEASSVFEYATPLTGNAPYQIEATEVSDLLIDRTIAVTVLNELLYGDAIGQGLVSDEEVRAYARRQYLDFQAASAEGSAPADLAGSSPADFESPERLEMYREFLAIDKMRSVLQASASDSGTNAYLGDWMRDALTRHVVVLSPKTGLVESDLPAIIAACPTAIC